MSEMKVPTGAQPSAPRKKAQTGAGSSGAKSGKKSAGSAAKKTAAGKSASSTPAKPRRKAAPKVAENPLAAAAERRAYAADEPEIYDIDDLRAPARRAAPLPDDAYDELDLPAKKSPARRRSAPKADSCDDLGVPSRKASARKKAAPKAEAYDELDLPVRKSPARRKPASRAEAYDELDLPVKKAPAKRRSVPRPDAYDELDLPVRPRRKSPPRAAAASRKPAPAVDPYDELDELPPRRPRRSSGSGGGPKKPRRSGDNLTLALSAAICVLALLIGLQVAQYARFAHMRSTVEQQVFFEGTIVDGFDVSGMTLEEAQRRWTEDVEPGYAGRTVTFDNGKTVTAGELGYSSDYLSVLANAWGTGRTGSLEERYASVSTRKEQPASYPVTRSFYDEEILEKYVQAAAKALDKAATEPHIASLNAETFEFTFEEGAPGQALDQEKMAADIRSTLSAGSGSVALSMTATQPRYTVADIRDSYGLVASAQTNASSSSSARLNNIRLSLKAINGVRLQPGETFSFNETVGERTTARGYQAAGAYAAGEVVNEVGGGICQVSTTLFNAVVKADLEITERHNHSMPVGYVDKGKDATVNWGGQDFKFTNNTDTEVYIGAYLTDNNRVRIGIFGRLLEDGRYITVEAVTTGTINFSTEYQTNFSLGPGEEKVVQSGRTGYTAEAYKIVWSADGKQLSKELLCTSKYASRKQIIETGP